MSITDLVLHPIAARAREALLKRPERGWVEYQPELDVSAVVQIVEPKGS